MSATVHVAAGALVDAQGKILLAKRHDESHQGGLWEFPGGKIEPDESGEAALYRELHEELGIQVRSSRLLIRICHQYPDLEVVLHVHRVDHWQGEPHGREGQPLAWVSPSGLDDYPMPAADRPVVRALQLPDSYVITPPRIDSSKHFLQRLDRLLADDIRLFQYRVFDIGDSEPLALFQEVAAYCREAGAMVMLNADLPYADQLHSDGLHLSGRQLHTCDRRPSGYRWVAASCHTAEDLRKAEALALDFAVVSPVLPTRSHPDAQPIGWKGFSELVGDAGIPVFALGGMNAGVLTEAWAAGAQGVAGIRGFWNDESI